MFCTKCRAEIPEGSRFCGSCGAAAGGGSSEGQPPRLGSTSRGERLAAGDFLSFRRMVTPGIIQVLFWIGVVASVVGGILRIATGDAAGIASGVVLLILGPIWVRVLCELLIVVFRIHDALTDIKDNTGRK